LKRFWKGRECSRGWPVRVDAAGVGTDRVKRLRHGFTLVEILVALALLAGLAALVFPTVVNQISKVDAIRAARDMNAIRAAVEAFNANTQTQPRFLTQLAFPITTADSSVARTRYSSRNVAGWNGAYLDRPLDPAIRFATAFRTGFDGRVQNDMICFRPSTDAVAPCGVGTFVAIRIDGLIGSRFEELNNLVDGEIEVDGRGAGFSRSEGRLRFTNDLGPDPATSPGITYYLAGPYVRI
jgi:prepilin-type N-terminal cleavage/methylation domain-containing protein